jgi:flavin reductase (DIM6/NTAB) family NADH-FMN oxidoreductase RutF
MQIYPTQLSREEGARLIYHLVVPRPIAWVSTLGEDGQPNVAPFSAYTFLHTDPPTLCLSLVPSQGRKKATLLNMERTADFVVNLVDERLAQPMALTGVAYEPGTNKFDIAGVTPAASLLVRSPRVQESPVSMECRLAQNLRLGREESPFDLVIGEVVLIHLRDDLWMGEGRIDFGRLGAIGQLAGDLYCRTGDTLEAKRPQGRGE